MASVNQSRLTELVRRTKYEGTEREQQHDLRRKQRLSLQALQVARRGGGEPVVPSPHRESGIAMHLLHETMLVDVSETKSIILNLVNGNADLIDNHTCESILSGDYSRIAESELNQLIERKHVFPDLEAASSYISAVEESLLSQTKMLPPSFVYIPSYSCNLDCYYCFEKAYEHDASLPNREAHSSVEAFLSTLKSIVHSFEESQQTILDPKTISVTVTGGEPFIPENLPAIQTLLTNCRNLGITPSFVTNGYCLEPFLPILKEFGISEIKITLDGSKPVHDSIRVTRSGAGTFDQITKNIDALSKFAKRLSVRINATKKNLCSISDPSFSSLVQAYPNVFFYLYFMQQEGCADKQNVLDELEGLKTALRIQDNCPALKNLDISYHGENVVRSVFGNGSFKPKIAMCAAMSNQYIFDYTGQIYKCWWGMGNPDYRVGSFSLLGYSIHRDLEDLYRLRNVTMIPKCRQCRFRFVCGGGCTGRLSRRDFALGETICPDFENILTFMLRHLYRSGENHGRS